MSKVKIKITADNVKGSESGHDLHHWEKGKTYEVCHSFAKVLVDADLAEAVKGKTKTEEKPAPAEPEVPAEDKEPEAEAKAGDEAPENKAVQSADENKAKETDKPKTDSKKK